jgi:hypothetical protein
LQELVLGTGVVTGENRLNVSLSQLAHIDALERIGHSSHGDTTQGFTLHDHLEPHVFRVDEIIRIERGHSAEIDRKETSVQRHIVLCFSPDRHASGRGVEKTEFQIYRPTNGDPLVICQDTLQWNQVRYVCRSNAECHSGCKKYCNC